MLDLTKPSRTLLAVHPLDWCALLMLMIVLGLGIATATMRDFSPAMAVALILAYASPLAIFLQVLLRTAKPR